LLLENNKGVKKWINLRKQNRAILVGFKMQTFPLYAAKKVLIMIKLRKTGIPKTK
jgi:hypothetical protein